MSILETPETSDFLNAMTLFYRARSGSGGGATSHPHHICLARCERISSGNVFVCKASGNVHFCGETMCDLSVEERSFTDVEIPVIREHTIRQERDEETSVWGDQDGDGDGEEFDLFRAGLDTWTSEQQHAKLGLERGVDTSRFKRKRAKCNQEFVKRVCTLTAQVFEPSLRSIRDETTADDLGVDRKETPGHDEEEHDEIDEEDAETRKRIKQKQTQLNKLKQAQMKATMSLGKKNKELVESGQNMFGKPPRPSNRASFAIPAATQSQQTKRRFYRSDSDED